MIPLPIDSSFSRELGFLASLSGETLKVQPSSSFLCSNLLRIHPNFQLDLTLFQSIVRLIFQQNGPTVDISAKTSFHW
jgi:hypothetical protein